MVVLCAQPENNLSSGFYHTLILDDLGQVTAEEIGHWAKLSVHVPLYTGCSGMILCLPMRC